MNTQNLINELYGCLVEALPSYNIFLNDDGKKIRNANTVDKNSEAEINCVEDALEQTGYAIIVCARLTVRAPMDDARRASLRKIIIPIEIRTQKKTDHDKSCCEVMDEVESAIVKISSYDDWVLGDAGEYENKPGWGMVKATHCYEVGVTND